MLLRFRHLDSELTDVNLKTLMILRFRQLDSGITGNFKQVCSYGLDI